MSLSPQDNSNEAMPVPADAENYTSPREQALKWLVFGVAAVIVLMRYPAFAKAAAIFIVTLSVLVFVHEWGHYQFALWAGMKVNRFGIGFPPWIYTKRRNGIDYSIGALPIGGMVDIAGLGSEEEMVATVKGSELTVDEPRRNIPHGEKQFQDAPLKWRFMTLFAGPMMNFIYAIIVFILIYSLIGLPKPVFSSRIERVVAGDPASKAGVRAGDRIVGVDALNSADPAKIGDAIRAAKGKPVTVVVERDGKTLRLPVAPVYKELPQLGRVPSIGIAFDSKIERMDYEKTTPLLAVKHGFISAANISLSILDTIKRAILFRLTKEEVREIGGPVKIAEAGNQISERGLVASILFSAMLSVNLGLMNLLPLPALDGGRIMFLGYEFVARKPLDPNKEGMVHVVGMVMLLAFMLLITIRDVLPYIQKAFGA
ncbi:MAG TPA: M50 family metallopeptidase [Abditibacteriaceae bacterium]